MSDKKRILAFFLFVGLFSLAFAIGAETEVSQEDAESFLKEFEALVEDIDSIGIFTHNLLIALPMFIPGFGIGWGLFAAWQTGAAFAAFAIINPNLLQIPPLSILYLTPFGLMELAAYSIAMSRSLFLVYNLVKKIPIIKNWKGTIIEIGIVIGLLLVGGLIEGYMIESFQEAQLSEFD